MLITFAITYRWFNSTNATMHYYVGNERGMVLDQQRLQLMMMSTANFIWDE